MLLVNCYIFLQGPLLLSWNSIRAVDGNETVKIAGNFKTKFGGRVCFYWVFSADSLGVGNEWNIFLSLPHNGEWRSQEKCLVLFSLRWSGQWNNSFSSKNEVEMLYMSRGYTMYALCLSFKVFPSHGPFQLQG